MSFVDVEKSLELSNSSFCYVLPISNTTNLKYLAIEWMYINHDLVMMKMGRWTLGRVEQEGDITILLQYHTILFHFL